MIYMVAAYLVIWLASFVFILSMVQRQRHLRSEIEALREVVGEEKVAPVRETAEYAPSPTSR
jgi:CcmD family protein